MAFETIKPFFQARMKVVDKDLLEWKDAFNDENIPKSGLDKAWHLTIGQAGFVEFAQSCMVYDVPVSLKLFFKGFKQTQLAVDFALLKVDAILKETLRHSVRLNQPYIKQITPRAWEITPLNQSNDNVAKLVVDFTCRVHLDIES